MDVDMALSTWPVGPTFNIGTLFIVIIHPFQNATDHADQFFPMTSSSSDPINQFPDNP
jgi:hypothetical protein